MKEELESKERQNHARLMEWYELNDSIYCVEESEIESLEVRP